MVGKPGRLLVARVSEACLIFGPVRIRSGCVGLGCSGDVPYLRQIERVFGLSAKSHTCGTLLVGGPVGAVHKKGAAGLGPVHG